MLLLYAEVWLLCVQVLLKFLQVFSEFDWDTFCLSLQGLIPLSSFPEFIGKACMLHYWCCVLYVRPCW